MTPLQTAYKAWQFHMPQSQQDCCRYMHFNYQGNIITSPKKDNEVCEREIAWRKVVRIRDGNPDWPFVSKTL